MNVNIILHTAKEDTRVRSLYLLFQKKVRQMFWELFMIYTELVLTLLFLYSQFHSSQIFPS